VIDDGKLVSLGDVITQRFADLEMEANVLRDDQAGGYEALAEGDIHRNRIAGILDR
jgi:hypothetical protein